MIFSTAFLFVCVSLFGQLSTAFTTIAASTSRNYCFPSTTTSLFESCSRRDAFSVILASAAVTVSAPQQAEAKYSDYTRREKDWEDRKRSGELQISTAKDLRKQLAAIVPANNEGSKIFCPNGASAAVSPLMENKCSDTLMALPSVYGRTVDATGNSIPGFSNGYAWANGDSSSSINSAVGGFPKYK